MLENRVKRVMREGGVALVGYAGPFPGPEIVEIAGRAGYDGVRFDLEHEAYGLEDIKVKVIAAERAGISPIVRIPNCDTNYILRLLDLGVQGITIPGIRTAEEAREAVRAVRYPPLGNRGMSNGSRAAEYGTVPSKRHLEESNREILLGLLIENLEAIDNIEAIAATEGVDLIAVGPNDLGSALGVDGQPDHPKLVAAIKRVAAAVAKNPNCYLSFSLGQKLFPRTLPELRAMGVRYMHCGPNADIRLLQSMAQQVQELRAL